MSDIETSFELNKSGWYEVDFVLDTDFDADQYGNEWYSVKFKGDAEAHLWLAKERPEENKKYYGHFEKTKSGKKLRFKRDKEPEEQARPNNAGGWKPKNEGQVTLNMVWKNLLNVVGVPETSTDKLKFWETVKEHTDELLSMGEKLNG